MGFDIYAGARFPGARHALTVDERVFDSFVQAHQQTTTPCRFLSRMNDPYGDADFGADELMPLIKELIALEDATQLEDVRALCKELREIVTRALGASHCIFCRGD